MAPSINTSQITLLRKQNFYGPLAFFHNNSNLGFRIGIFFYLLYDFGHTDIQSFYFFLMKVL